MISLACQIFSVQPHSAYILQQLSCILRKPDFAFAKTKMQISFAVTPKLISTFVFATRIVQFLYYLNPKFQASNHLVWLYSPVCVGPGRKPGRPVFSQRGSIYIVKLYLTFKVWLRLFILYVFCFIAETVTNQMSLVMRKSAFFICENKDAEQLRSNCAADQRLCFRYTDNTIPPLLKSEISSL